MTMAEISPYGKKTLWEKEKLFVTAISPFPTVFSKYFYCRHVKIRAYLGKGQGLKVALQILGLNFTKVLKNHPYTPKAF